MAGGCGATSNGKQGTNGAILGLGTGSGGGGGGFGAQGSGGSGMNSGMGGDPSGNDMLVPVDTTPGVAGNRGNGGGGGGGGTPAGGPGGGGGGVIVLDAGGDITVGAMGALRVQGGNGVGNGGSGGGGSGGALLVRAGGTITSSTMWLSAPPGAGGAGNNPGGAGGIGRIRVDAAAGNVQSMANNPPAKRGPAWGTTVPSLVMSSSITAEFRGEPGRPFDIRINDNPTNIMATPGSGGTVDVPGIALVPGRNTVCAVAVSGMISTPESKTCVTLFYAGN
jgi:hypothetical protein